MSAVFQCPRCNRPLGTEADPRPDPLPACRNCGWEPRALDESVRLNRNAFREAGINLGLVILGVGAASVTLHAHLFTLVALVVLGPGVTSTLGRYGGENSWVYVLSYSCGLMIGLLVLNQLPGWGYALTVAMLSAAVGLVRSLFFNR